MLDIHPPHHAANTWRDFFIHIATIVVGLLIAIGLEQTVERIHQRYELRETREALEHEAEANRKDLIQDARQWREEMVELENNLTVLRYIQHHPGAPQTTLPGVLEWEQSLVRYESAVWDAAEQNGITRRMSPEESNRHRTIYMILRTFSSQGLDDWNAFNDAGRYRVFDTNPTHMTGDELDRTLLLLQINMEKHIQIGDTLALMNQAFPELGSPLTFDEVNAFIPLPEESDRSAMDPAYQLTRTRLQAANKDALK